MAKIVVQPPFQGFSKKGISFLRALKKNNDRDWFQKRKPVYESELIAPSKSFLQDAVKPLKGLIPSLNVTPRSMSRIYRDVRFSDDKSPYHSHLAFLFRDLRGTEEFAPRLYMGFDPTGLAYGAGTFQFTTPQRDRFRTMITEGPSAKSFEAIMKKIRKTTGFEPRGKALKKFPVGFDPKHPNSEFLLYNGLYLVFEEDFPKSFFTKDFYKYLTKIYKPLVPFMDWMADFAQQAPRSMERFVDIDESDLN